MDALILPMILQIFCFSMLSQCLTTQARVTVSATAPMTSVDEGGILSVHCEVSNLEQGQSVMLVRQLKGNRVDVESLSLKEVVQTSDDDRVFLAVRQMPGNTFVYFLSIIDVTREDEAEYSCRVMSKSMDKVTARDSVNVSVNYFPEDTNPVCSHGMGSDLLTVQEGDLVSLNCTSERGNPPVSIHWTRSGESLKSTTQTPAGSSFVFNVLQFYATRYHDASLFLCQVQSNAFPDLTSTCHVGPIKVHYDSNVNNAVDINAPVQATAALQETSTIISTKGTLVISDERVRCKDICSISSGPAFYWIIATVIAGCLALLFLILGTVLLLKYCRMASNGDEHALQTRQEDFYEKLQYRNNREEMVYMSLGNSNRMKGKGSSEVHYCLTPNKPSYMGTTRPLTE